MCGKRGAFSPCGHVPQADGELSAIAERSHGLAIGGKDDRPDLALVAAKAAQFFSRGRLPQAHRAVPAARDQRSIGSKSDRTDWAMMSAKRWQLLAGRRVPEHN